jgi:hypothetical protein
MLNEMVVWIVRLDKNEKMGLSLEKKGPPIRLSEKRH